MDECKTYLKKAYRFLTFDGLFKTIETKSFRLTRVDKFNDPLDNSPLITPSDWIEYSREENKGFFSIAKEHIFKNVFKSNYICCFSKHYCENDSYLMWSHYADSHSQVCFEIDFSIHKYLGGPSEVSYPDCLVTERENFKTNKDINDSKLGLFLVTNKLNNWSYESEVRLIVDILHPNFDYQRFKISDNADYIFADFDLKLISKVIFGVESKLFNELKTRCLFEGNNLYPKYEKMYIDPIDLKLKSKTYKFK
ncbi:DUF2971 domain-containing protein [Pontimicrobium sp. SW4]|uniref:DUF2971 domain-containing protein n=1 Tax=Pontimicrobium sp. SW4 TaxID=3153519 RepID=A0AAU7BWL5_9FLAO